MNKSRNVALLTIGRGINAVVNLLFLPYMARALSYQDYATYGQVLLVIEIFLIIVGVANNQYLYVLLSKNKAHNKRDVVKTAVIINLLTGLAGVLILYLSIPFISSSFENPELAKAIRIYGFSIIPLLLSSTFDYILYYFNRIKHVLLIQLISNLLRVTFIIISVQIFNSIQLIFWLLILLNILLLFLYIPKFPVKIAIGKANSEIASHFFKFGYVLGISAILGTLIKRTDGIMISSMLEPKLYSIYRMGAIEVPFLMLFYSSVLTVLLPNVTRLFNDGKINELISLKKTAISGSVLAIYPALIFLLFFAEPILGFYLGEKYLASVPIFVLYNAILFFRVNDYRDILISASKTKWIVQMDLFIFVLNIVLNYIFIINYSLIGAVVASLISFIILAMTLNILTTRFLNIQALSFFNIKLITFVALISAVFSSFAYLLFCELQNLFLIPILFISYICLVYGVLLKMNKESEKLIKRIFNGIRGKA